MTIHWKRNSCLDGMRVTVDAYVAGRRVGQISSTESASGKRAWQVWLAGDGRTGGTHRTLTLAKAEIRASVSPQQV